MLIINNINNIILNRIYRIYNYIIWDIFKRDDLQACVPCKFWKRKDKNWQIYFIFNWNRYNQLTK